MARKVSSEPNATGQADIQSLRDAGFTDMQIFAITVYVAARLAFSTVNDALGSTPDAELAASLPQAVREATMFGRRPAAPGRGFPPG